WDNAAWHVSKRVRRWIGAHNRRVKRDGGCKIRVCYLPVKAPWLNPIEPKWLHGKRAIVEADRKLTASEVKQRVHEHYRCQPEEPLTQTPPGTCPSARAARPARGGGGVPAGCAGAGVRAALAPDAGRPRAPPPATPPSTTPGLGGMDSLDPVGRFARLSGR